MKRQSATVVAVMGVLTLLLLACTAWEWVLAGHKTALLGANGNPPFQDKLGIEVVRPIQAFDVSPASSVYRKVPVLTAQGRQITLDATREPLLFVAYWCPHCQRTLALLNRNQAVLGQKPILVSMGFTNGTSLHQAVQIEEAEIKFLRLHGFSVDYLLNVNPARYVPATYPTLVFNDSRHGLMSLHSEHTLSVWARALN